MNQAFEVGSAESDHDLTDVLEVITAVHSEVAPTLEGLRHSIAISFGKRYFVARLAREAVGCASCGAFPGTENDSYVEAEVSVLAAHRRRGIGSALLRAVSEHARSLGKTGLTIEAREDTPEAIEFLERRGFEEVERQKALALDLRGLDLPEPRPPEGVEIVSRAERPEVERGIYEVAKEAHADMPGLDSGFEQTFEQWRSFEIERPSRWRELSFVAVAGDEVVGHASLDAWGNVASHGLTAVRRDWRRRGIARALKLAEIRAAQAAGFERVLTESEERNEPMRRLNESLGFRPIPGMVVMRGSLLT